MKEYRMRIHDVGFCKLSVVDYSTTTGCIRSRIAGTRLFDAGPLCCRSLVWFFFYFFFYFYFLFLKKFGPLCIRLGYPD